MDDSQKLERWIGLLNDRRYAVVIVECEGVGDLLDRSSMACLVLATALEASGQRDRAGRSFDSAVELEPGNVIAQNNRAGFLERQGRVGEALLGYEAAAAAAPKLATVHVNRGRMLGLLDRKEEALAALDRAVELQPAMVEAQLERGLALGRLGRDQEAEHAYRNALRLAPQLEAARLDLVKLLFRGKRLAECLAEAELGLAEIPGSAMLCYWHGATLRVEGKLIEAIAAMDRCLAITPKDLGALCDKAQMLETLGRTADALSVFEAALTVDPDHVTALNGVAATSWTLGRKEAALATIGRALQIAPGSSNSLLIRASFYQLSGQSGEAIQDARRVVELAPRDPRGWHLLADLASDRGNHAEALDHLAKASALAPGEPAIESAILWNLLHVPEARRDDVVERHRAWGQHFGQRGGTAAPCFTNRRDALRRLRLGFVSADLENHPVGRLLNAVLPSFDRQQLHVTCYNNSPEGDFVTEELRSGSDGWQEIWGVDDRALASLVRADEIDILIDLSGHTKGNRLRCFAMRAAPVQATLWGYPFSTGLEVMDYAIMDEAAVPLGAEDMFVERVIRLPGGRFRLRRPQFGLPVSMPPSTRRGHVTFGSFNNIAKLNDHVYDAWAAILQRVPKSRLLLKWFNLGDPGVAANIRSAFVARGIGADRLVLRASSDYEKMLSEYSDMDIALDPFPFSGGITSFEALWMGVPIVTLPGWQPVSRQTLGYLRAIGRESLAAKDADDYVAIAARVAADPSLLTAWRRDQRQVVEKSSICNFIGAAEELEQVFRKMWKEYLASTCSHATTCDRD